MSQRPTRQCSRDAVQKIKNILAWEECPESSEVFKAAAAQIEREFAQMKRRRVSAQTTDIDSEHDDEIDEDEEDDENDDGSAPDEEYVDSLYSDNASSDDSGVEDDDECQSSDCDSAGEVACTTDVAPTVHVECQPDVEPEGP